MEMILEIVLLITSPMKKAIAALQAQVAELAPSAVKDLTTAIAGAVSSGFVNLTAQIAAIQSLVTALAASVFAPVAGAYHHAVTGGDPTIGVGTAFPMFDTTDVATAGLSTPNPSTLTIATLGTYSLRWQASVTEPGQMEVWLDKGSGFGRIARTTVGRATGTSQIVGETVMVIDTLPTSIQIRNPPGNATALTMTPIAGGATSVNVSAFIQKIG